MPSEGMIARPAPLVCAPPVFGCRETSWGCNLGIALAMSDTVARAFSILSFAGFAIFFVRAGVYFILMSNRMEKRGSIIVALLPFLAPFAKSIYDPTGKKHQAKFLKSILLAIIFALLTIVSFNSLRIA